MEKLKFKYFDQINDYFYGGMSEEEKLLFDAQIVLNKDLAEEVEVFRQVNSRFKELHYLRLKSELQILDRVMDKDLSRSPFSNKVVSLWFMGIACCSILFLGFISWSLWFKNNSAAFAKFEEFEIGLPVKMGPENLKFDEAMSQYKQKNYSGSVNILEKLRIDNPSDTIDYFVGVNYYELGEFPAALTSFRKVKPKSVFYEKSQYRAALTFLHLNQPAKAKPILTELVSSNSQYRLKAKQIMLEIN